MRKIFKRMTALVLTAAVAISAECGGVRIHGVSPDIKEARAAETSGIYISDVAISYASSREAAEKELGKEYTVLENKIGESFVGYTTTDDPDLAIRDMKVQAMDGKYSVSDYEEVLKNHQETIKDQVDILVPALIEFTKNVDLGMDAAVIVCKHLNCFYEDDTDMAFGDYLLEQGRKLITDLYDASAHIELEKIYVEANNDLIQQMENLITQGIDTKVYKKGTWLTRMSELGPRGLIDLYKQSFKNLRSDSAVKKQLEKDYGEDAAMLYSELPRIQTYLRDRVNSDVAKAIENGDAGEVDSLSEEIENTEGGTEPTNESTIEEIAESLGQSMDKLPDAMDFSENINMEAIALVLKGTPYGDQTMYDFLMNENITKSDLYTFAYVLTDGQKSIIRDVGLYSIFQSAVSGYAEEDEESYIFDEVGEKAFSIYDGVDRDVFNGDTALTEDALKRMQTKADNWSLTTASCISGVLAVVSAGIGIACTVRLGSVIKNGGVLKKVGYENMKITMSGNCTEAYKAADEAVKTLQEEIQIMSKNQYALRGKWIENTGILKNFKFDIVGKSPAQIESAFKAAYPQLRAEGKFAKVIMMSNNEEKVFLNHKKVGLRQKIAARNEIGASKVVKFEKVKVTTTRTFGIGSRIIYTLGAVAAFAFAGYEIYQMTKKSPKIVYTEIPAKMVNRTYDEDETNYMTYSVARTRDGKKADLRNWKGSQWVALYTTSDENAGDPILASTFVSSENNMTSDADMVSVSEFCFKDAYNISENNATYLFFKKGTEAVASVETDETKAPGETEADETGETASGAADTTGTAFGGSSVIWIILLLVVVIGVGAGTGVYIRKRKK
ncbi:MAG: hypothetical protein J6P16_00660 [Eubacterium sp.]|nr:hypothetical protein [Eubacterium sp.]